MTTPPSFRNCGERLLKIGIFACFYDPNLSAKGSCGGLDVAPSHIGEIDIRIIQVTNSRTSWDNLVYKLQTFGFEVSTENGHAGDVATRGRHTTTSNGGCVHHRKLGCECPLL
jgi:hypothetical protein